MRNNKDKKNMCSQHVVLKVKVKEKVNCMCEDGIVTVHLLCRVLSPAEGGVNNGHLKLW